MTCSFSNSSSTTSSGWRRVTSRKSRPSAVCAQQRLALGLRQRLGIALRQEDPPRDLLGPAVPLAERRSVPARKARDVGDGLLEVAAQHQRGAVEMRLAELVARRDVGHPAIEPEILEPGRLGDVEMVDRMQVVIEARPGHLAGRKPAAIGQAAFDQQDLQARPGEIRAQHQAVVAGADDDAVVARSSACTALLRSLPLSATYGRSLSRCRAVSLGAGERRPICAFGHCGNCVF